MASEYPPEFKKWLTYAAGEAIPGGVYDSLWRQRWASRAIGNGSVMHAVICDEGGKRTTKTNMDDTTVTFIYIAEVGIFEDESFTEFLFTDDGRVWQHKIPEDPSQPEIREFVDAGYADKILEEATR